MFIDAGMNRPKAIGMVVGISYLLGIPSAINLNILSNQDFVWGVALMISGAFVAYSIIRYGASAFRNEAVDSIKDDWNAGKMWEVIIKYIVPIEAAVLLVWFMWVSATEYAPDSWFNPLEPLSVMTALLQWSIVAVAFILLNKKLNQRMFSPLR